MKKKTADFYQLSELDQYQNVDLQFLSETCAILERKVLAIAEELPLEKRAIIEDYIASRNDLEVEAMQTALRPKEKYYY